MAQGGQRGSNWLIGFGSVLNLRRKTDTRDDSASRPTGEGIILDCTSDIALPELALWQIEGTFLTQPLSNACAYPCVRAQ